MKQFFQKYKAEIFVGTSALLAGVLSFFITLNVYPKAKVQVPVKKAEEQIAREESEMIKNEGGTELLEVEKKNEEEPEIVIVLGEPKKDSKIEDEEEQSKELYNETDEEEGLIEAEIIEESEEIKIARENSEEKVDMNSQESTSEIKEAISQNAEVSIGLPISGEIILEFAKDKLVYSETLEEWITHDGIDIKGTVAEPVKAVLAGTVESVKMDPRYGNTIIIKHNDSLKTVYANLSTLELVYVGKNVEEGEIISGVGEGFGFESKEGPHVHFEIVENGETREP